MISLYNPRLALLRAIICDLIGSLLIFALISLLSSINYNDRSHIYLALQIPWLVFCICTYFTWGWLFGIFSILRWEKLKRTVLLQRIFLTIFFSLFSVAIARWIVNPSDFIWLLHRKIQISWISGLGVWSFWVRNAIRKGVFLPQATETVLVVESEEKEYLVNIWIEVNQFIPFEVVAIEELKSIIRDRKNPIVIVYSRKIEFLPEFQSLLEHLEDNNPLQYHFISILTYFEENQYRLPPGLLPKNFITYGSTKWASSLNTQVQLKRLADVFLATLMLILFSPIILLASILIWLEDNGPVFFVQKRSGFLGQPFSIFKLRTMSVQSTDIPASWTQLADRRITKVGNILRKTRIDELPQLWNVINGDMSLIGPRPERPELEIELESHLNHYRKRYWMRPGLSGWAQVCSHYASSVEDSSIKLSFDLYYLKNFSFLIDFVILMRTIKTILKGTGR